MPTLTVNDVIQAGRNIYYIPHNDETIMFSPDSNSVMLANDNVRFLVDSCSMPLTYGQLQNLLLEKYGDNIDEVASLLSRLHISGFISINGSFYSNPDPSNTVTVTDKSVQNRSIVPSSASLHLTDRCNLKCTYCYNEASRRDQRIELDAKQWEQLLDDITSCGVKQVTASGGEPILRKELFPLFEEIRGKGIRTQIITNGTLITKEIASILAKSFDDVIVSLDSHVQESNDKNRGSGVCERVLHALSIMEEMDIPFVLNSVLTKNNIEDYIEMRDYFSIFKSCKEVKPIVYERTTINDSLCPTYSQIDKYYADLYKHIYTDDKLSNISTDLRKGLIVPRGGCGAGRTEFAVGPDGSLYPCRALYFGEFDSGSILKSGFIDLWTNSEVLEKVRFADVNRQSTCIESDCDLFNYCLGGCFGHTFAALGKLKPWASEFDCYRIKAQTRHMLITTIRAAKKGDGILETI